MDAESDDFPSGFDGASSWGALVEYLRLFRPVSRVGLTARYDDGLTNSQRDYRKHRAKRMKAAADWAMRPANHARRMAKQRARRAALKAAR